MFDILVNIYECVLMTLFTAVNSPQRKRSVPAFLICAFMLFVFITACNYYSPSEGFLSAVDVLILWLYLRAVSKDGAWQNLFVAVMTCVIITVTNVILSVFLGNLMYRSVYYETFMAEHSVCIILLAQIFHTAVYYCVIKRYRRDYVTYDARECRLLSLVFVLVDITALCFHTVIMKEGNIERNLTIGVLCNTLMILALVRFFRVFHLHKMEHERTVLEVSVLREQVSSGEKILAAQKEIQEMRHDMKHFIQTLKQELKAVPDEQIRAKLAEYEQHLNGTVTPVYTIVPAINFVLNAKREEAFKKGIDFVCRLNVTCDPGLEDEDMYILLGNALDNAIHHIGSAKKILVEMREVQEMFMIMVKNSIDHPVLDENGDLVRLSDREEHGFGVISMNRVAGKYSGFVTFTESAEDLICTILLKKGSG